jgi:spore coat polysaccharide biosynthesis protein SpsF (cytidylyltransferase family)/aryl-alcohol dehydrogenase-like predicted oxidoreductase
MYDPVPTSGRNALARQVRIILQARTSSSRLTAKVLMPIAGIPLAILCARRLGSSGLSVVLATSQDRTDDLLAFMAEASGLKVFRGSLNNVLDRFVQCAADLNDEDLVVRATADNPLPNGGFIDALLLRFGEGTREYLATSWPIDGLPYGLCAEVMTVAALRRAAEAARDPFDLEHVTPWLARQAAAEGDVRMGRLLDADYSHLRATIDTLDDYLTLASAFADIAEPIEIGWSQVIPKLPAQARIAARLPALPGNGASFARITLGTVQLGLNYGVANKSGKPSEAEASAILCAAVNAGITHLDTARAYGESESRIGKLLSPDAKSAVKIITKLQPWDSLPDDAPEREINSAVDASVYGSCRDLRRERLDVVMFHRIADMFRWQGAVTNRLQELCARGVIGAIGASVYAPGEAIQALLDRRITHLQIPFNLVDARWLDGAFADALAQRPEIFVHARSVFLQGLLINGADTWPEWVAQPQRYIQRIADLVDDFKRKNAADLCMAYVRSFSWVSTLVLGVETLHQLEDLLSCAALPALTQDQSRSVRSRLDNVPARLFNPSLW